MVKRVARLGGVALVALLAALLITSLALAYSTDFESVPSGTPLDGLALPGMTFAASEMSMVLPFFDSLLPDAQFTHLAGNVAVVANLIGPVSEPTAWIDITLDEPQDFVSFGYAYIQAFMEPTLTGATPMGAAPTSPFLVYGELDGETVYSTQLPVGELIFEEGGLAIYEGSATLNGRVDRIRITFGDSLFYLDNIETGLAPEEPAPMLCTTGDGSLNALHCGRPVAVFAKSGGFAIYGVDVNTGNGTLAEEVGKAAIDEVGVPVDSPVVIAEGQNPYNFRPFTLYRLPGGEFQLNTYYWDGKPYVIKWAAGDSAVTVVEW